MIFLHYLANSHPLFSSLENLILNGMENSQMLKVMYFFHQLQSSKTLKNSRKMHVLIHIALELKRNSSL